MRLLLTVAFLFLAVSVFAQRKFTWKERAAMCMYLNEPYYEGRTWDPTDTSKGEVYFLVPHPDTAVSKDRVFNAYLLVDFVLNNVDLFRGDSSIIDFIRIVDYYMYDSTIFRSVDIKPNYEDISFLNVLKRLRSSAPDRLALLLANSAMKFDVSHKRKLFSGKRMIFTFSEKGLIDYNFITFVGTKDLKELFYGNLTRMVYTYVLNNKRRGYAKIEYRFPAKYIGFDPIVYDLRGKEFKKFLEEKVFKQ